MIYSPKTLYYIGLKFQLLTVALSGINLIYMFPLIDKKLTDND